ncbi:MAG: hypothetical protein IJC67_04860, partial [Clostridia bacterium]|nr:hypothetical protein [Clostridia bacterium]
MKNRTKTKVADTVIAIIGIIIGLIIIFPVIYCIFGAFKTPAEFMSPQLLPNSFAYLENFKEAMQKAPL